MPREGLGKTLPNCAIIGRRTGPVPPRRTHSGSAGGYAGKTLALVPAPARFGEPRSRPPCSSLHWCGGRVVEMAAGGTECDDGSGTTPAHRASQPKVGNTKG